jgi:quercetin dioxygenase-like cupin family protein/alkylhydroperoxidase/carboxymuconolactone decarboxylase family protein YurZ
MGNVLCAKGQALARIASCAARGDLASLKPALGQGLDAGLSVNEIREALIQLYAYAGFPRSLNALSAFMETIAARKKQGISDIEGETPKTVAPEAAFDQGRQTQTALSGAPVEGALFDFAPGIARFLKTHLFGDLFGRGVLSPQQRELATIAMLASMEGVEGQLQAHLRLGQNAGLAPEAEAEILAIAAYAAIEAPGIFPRGELAPSGASGNFSGEAWIRTLLPKDETGHFAAGDVRFAPGCRNRWHTHPAGQVLLATAGRGWYQERGKAARRLEKGDVVQIPSHVEHWHGAAADAPFTHIAITSIVEGAAVEWLEPVSDAEYAALPGQ